MSYIPKRLFEGESITYVGEFHWTQKMVPWLWLIFLGVLLIGIYMFIKTLVRLKTTEFVVTSRRVILKRGLFKTRMDEIELDAIEGSHITQNMWGRLFGFGNIHIKGRGEGTLDLPVMKRPGQFVAATEKSRMKAEHAPIRQMEQSLKRSPKRAIAR